MSTQFNPYISFPGTAREALTFYAEVFGGETEFTQYSEFGVLPEGAPNGDKIMHSEMRSEVVTINASDYVAGFGPTQIRGNDISMALMGTDEAQLRGWFDKLAEGGSVNMPLEQQLWGDLYGDCTDKFGISWMVNISTPEA